MKASHKALTPRTGRNKKKVAKKRRVDAAMVFRIAVPWVAPIITPSAMKAKKQQKGMAMAQPMHSPAASIVDGEGLNHVKMVLQPKVKASV